MRSFLLFLFAILSAGYINAQPTITSGDLVQAGDIFINQSAKVAGVSLGTIGPNRTWDYSTLVDSGATTSDSFVTAASTPYASLFPLATLAEHNNGQFTYFQSTSNAVKILGLITTGDTTYFSKPLAYIQYPITYGTTFNDSAFVYAHLTGMKDTANYHDTVIATGYGTLKLPGKTYANVLQLTQAFTISTSFGTFKTVSIIYVTPGIPGSLLQISVGLFGAPQNVTYQVSSSVVPVKLISFSALASGNTVNLSWQTTGELNTAYYELEKSTDGVHFTTVQQIKASGNASVNNYSFTDLQAADGKNYYRLKQIDNNGSFTYSRIVSVNVTLNDQVRIAPNPVHGNSFILSYNSSRSYQTQLSVTGTDGRILMKQSVNITTGSNNHSININKLSKGIYFVSFILNGEQRVLKLLKE